MALHPFRFGVVAAQARSGEEWAEKARRVESLGYATLVIPDNIQYTLAPLLALAAAAAATHTLRVGTYVLANDYRNPVMLAKEAATLDLLSGGRFELGIGAGRPPRMIIRCSVFLLRRAACASRGWQNRLPSSNRSSRGSARARPGRTMPQRTRRSPRSPPSSPDCPSSSPGAARNCSPSPRARRTSSRSASARTRLNP